MENKAKVSRQRYRSQTNSKGSLCVPADESQGGGMSGWVCSCVYTSFKFSSTLLGWSVTLFVCECTVQWKYEVQGRPILDATSFIFCPVGVGVWLFLCESVQYSENM